MKREEKNRLIDNIAAYIEKYRNDETMTSYRLARAALIMAIGEEEEIFGQCGLTTMTTPVVLNVANDRFMITVKERSLTWTNNYLTAKDVEELKTFLEHTYKTGFEDGSQIAMNRKDGKISNVS